MNSRAKGKRGELEACAALARVGLDCRRTAQYCGQNGTSDVVCDDAPRLHVEVKLTERLAPYAFMDQAIRDIGRLPRVPVVLCRSSHRPWLLIIRLDDLPEFVKDYTDARIVQAPVAGKEVRPDRADTA